MLRLPFPTSELVGAMVPRDSESGLVAVVAWIALIVFLVTLGNIRRWRQVLREAERRGDTVPVEGRRSFARRVAEWSLGLSVLLGACSAPSDAPAIEHLGPAPERAMQSTELPPSTAVESSTTTAPPTTLAPSTTAAPTTVLPTTTIDEPDAADGDLEGADPEDDDEPAAGPAGADEPAPIWTPTSDLPTAHVVQQGEHLWGIAEASLADRLGTRPSTSDVATYWVEVIALNRSMLRSGDPDLIHPGEAVLLPPISVLQPATG